MTDSTLRALSQPPPAAPYLKRARSVEELIPCLYLKGIATGDDQKALAALLGDQAKGLSANTLSRLKKQWEDELGAWQERDLAGRRCVYWWADGIYSNLPMDDCLRLLVIIGVTEQGHKERVAVEDAMGVAVTARRAGRTAIRLRLMRPNYTFGVRAIRVAL